MGLLDGMSYGLLGGGGGMDPAMGLQNQTSSARLGGLRELRYLHQPASPLQRAPRANSMGGNPLLPEGPDYSAYTYDPQMRAMAQASGVNPLAPDQVNPNAMFPNRGFFGNHPRLTSGLEGAIFGAAATQPGQTIGENISNVARGMIEGPQMKSALVRRQFEAPFQNAMMMENLRDMQGKRALNDSEIQFRHAQINRFSDETDLAQQRIAMQQEQGDLKNVIAQERAENASLRGGASMSDVRRAYEASHGPEPPAGGPKNKDGRTNQEAWGDGFYNYQIGKGVAIAGGGQHARNQTDLKDDVKTPASQKESDAKTKRMEDFMSKHSKDYSFWQKNVGKARPTAQEQMNYFNQQIEPNGSPVGVNPSSPSTADPKTNNPAPAASGTGSKLTGMLGDWQKSKQMKAQQPSNFNSPAGAAPLPFNLANFINQPTPGSNEDQTRIQSPFPK